ncbi:hypothetical protein AB0F52_31765 [Amycolatopsis sp. NPDC024027]|uniref:hypothetical protein n=1 Tax=Amycolatopsis sp. NPDC024027 TaxID=3154327 RepID=UPI0033C26B2B
MSIRVDHQGWWSRPAERQKVPGPRRGSPLPGEPGPDTFRVSARVALTPEELTLATVDDFLAVLRLVLERSGLTAGQVAAKTSIARSSAYNLVSVSRRGLPVDPDQVLLFLTGCGLRMDQVDEIMRAWGRFALERRRHRASGELRPEPEPPRRNVDVGVDRCLEQLRLVRAAGDLDKAVTWARRLTSALLAEKAVEHVAARSVCSG